MPVYIYLGDVYFLSNFTYKGKGLQYDSIQLCTVNKRVKLRTPPHNYIREQCTCSVHR